MRVLVTGSRGFIGKNLVVKLNETREHEVIEFYKGKHLADLASAIQSADFLFHLAGVNRPRDKNEFFDGNVNLTQSICAILTKNKTKTPVLFASSTKASQPSDYGKSKALAEQAIKDLSSSNGNPVLIYRLPNVFGKWSKPNYNSVVATFCSNVIRGLPIDIHNPDSSIRLVYIDDLVNQWISDLDFSRDLNKGTHYGEVKKTYDISVGELAKKIKAFNLNRKKSIVDDVGLGLTRALYATFLSFLEPEDFCLPVHPHKDQRGMFAEFVKTKESGQFSFFTAEPGVTRGGHYHHTKFEKFLIIQGQARFSFRSQLTGETHAIEVGASSLQMVESVPGWAHKIENIGTDTLIGILWANEIFDPSSPDTIPIEMSS